MSPGQHLAAFLAMLALSVSAVLLHDYDGGGILSVIRYVGLFYLGLVGLAGLIYLALAALAFHAQHTQKSQAFRDLERDIHGILPARVLTTLPRDGDKVPDLIWSWVEGLRLSRGRSPNEQDYLAILSKGEADRLGEAVKRLLSSKLGPMRTALLFASGVNIPVHNLSNHQVMEAIARTRRST